VLPSNFRDVTGEKVGTVIAKRGGDRLGGGNEARVTDTAYARGRMVAVVIAFVGVVIAAIGVTIAGLHLR
jgi:hypothetical protein